jgi:hypothetical protein
MPTAGCLALSLGAPQGEPEINDADADNLDMAGDIDYGFAAATRRGIESPREPCLIFKQLRQSDGKHAPPLVTCNERAMIKSACPMRGHGMLDRPHSAGDGTIEK